MTTLIIEIKDSSDAKKIADVLSLMDSVVNITFQESAKQIPDLPYTQAERVASVHRSIEDVRAGRVHSAEDVRAMFPEP